MKKKNLIAYITDRKGSALAMVMIAMLFISILLTSVFFITSSNTREVTNQEQGIASYYMARSGAEAMYETLITRTPSLLEQFKNDSTAEINHTINFPEGVAIVKVNVFNEGAVKRIRIVSTGKENNTKMDRRSILEFDLDGYSNIKWSR